MINEQKILAIIPARGGSKGLPGKNIYTFGGKPLIAWTIEAAKASLYIDRLILSSDDEDIINVAKSYECEVPFTRDPQLALDDTPSIDVVIDAINRCPGYDWILLLQPTSPLRVAHDIDEAIRCCMEQEADACVSVSEVKQSPYWMYTLSDSRTLKPVISSPIPARRQDLPPCYTLNGAIYLAKINSLLQSKTFILAKTVPYLLPEERAIDIDTLDDILLAESLLNSL
ncbi:acylneuraminate cytidylyltransferase family protein [Legionella fallonii]|uniref:N-acylneuraminate cytidylyltransferase n=1 Tax=Legionella fallonii LLAP-10 TaxID=1212491 RepID=A0A098G439_9GAMM|nr:acylneuraminate cytidylyltransferase family protein [Legionella fallonii]CEG56250.1 N-acylneuraminate cytidylyltransferase [Legionella fallonii LLAP-10]